MKHDLIQKYIYRLTLISPIKHHMNKSQNALAQIFKL